MSKNSPPLSGVAIKTGLHDWQILQQNELGTADATVTGSWTCEGPFTKAQVMVRVLRENTGAAIGPDFEWQEASTEADGQWHFTVGQIPAGGLYRLETILRVDECAVEWGRRGDMCHHFGVGDVWVIAGQSNAAGYGKAPCEDEPRIGVHLFGLDGNWKLAAHPFSDSTRARYLNTEAANGSHSPFLRFGTILHAALGYPIGLIPAALGGSPISRWVYDPDSQANGDLFANMLTMLRDARASCRGMLWYQGESDAAPESRALYGGRFQQMIDDLRSEMKQPQLPVLTAQLNRYVGEPLSSPVHENWEDMRELQRQLAASIPGVEIIPTLDLGLSDGIHNHSDANTVIGRRMADAALGAVYGKKVHFRAPEVCAIQQSSPTTLELHFANVSGRLHYENLIDSDFPFAVRDCEGTIEILSWELQMPNRLVLKLAQAPKADLVVIGAPTSNPPSNLPFDTHSFLPMLGFKLPVGSDIPSPPTA